MHSLLRSRIYGIVAIATAEYAPSKKKKIIIITVQILHTTKHLFGLRSLTFG